MSNGSCCSSSPSQLASASAGSSLPLDRHRSFLFQRSRLGSPPPSLDFTSCLRDIPQRCCREGSLAHQCSLHWCSLPRGHGWLRIALDIMQASQALLQSRVKQVRLPDMMFEALPSPRKPTYTGCVVATHGADHLISIEDAAESRGMFVRCTRPFSSQTLLLLPIHGLRALDRVRSVAVPPQSNRLVHGL